VPWVPDSTTAGYLGPNDPPSPAPLQDDQWENFLHDWIAGISGYDPTMLHPRWQPEGVNLADFGTDWMAFGVEVTVPDFMPWEGHIDTPDGGYDAVQEHEIVEVMCSFYGPNCERYASITRRGAFLDQNRAALRANATGLVEITPFTHAPEQIMEQWLSRVDMTIVLRREIRYDYNVRTLVRAQGTITANPAEPDRTVVTEFDTADVLAPSPSEE